MSKSPDRTARQHGKEGCPLGQMLGHPDEYNKGRYHDASPSNTHHACKKTGEHPCNDEDQ